MPGSPDPLGATQFQVCRDHRNYSRRFGVSVLSGVDYSCRLSVLLSSPPRTG